MSDFNLEVTKRETNVKNVFKKSIKNGFIAGIFYNKNQNVPISIPRTFFEKQFSKAKTNTIFNIKIGSEEHQAYVKDYTTSLTQSKQIQHVDFYKIKAGSKLKIKIPVNIEGLAKGVVKGGHIEHYVWELKVTCDADKIPKEIKIDITELDIGGRILVADLPKIDGVQILDSLDKAIVGVMASSKVASAANADDKNDVDKNESQEVKK